jgi:hypothetical protein
MSVATKDCYIEGTKMGRILTQITSWASCLVFPSAMCVIMLAAAPLTYAGQTTLAWDANSDPAVIGYMVYSGESSGNYASIVDAGNKTIATVGGLRDGVTYYHAVTSYNAAREESAYSSEVSGVAKAGGPIAATSGGLAGGGGGCAVLRGPVDPVLPLLFMTALSALSLRSKRTAAERSKAFLSHR